MRIIKLNTYDISSNSFFSESRLAFYRRKEGNTWEEEKRDERGMGVAESVISDYEEYYRPDNLEVSGDHPDEITHGVRDRMMQGPLGATNILSGGAILERRVYEELERTAANAPRLYRQMLNEEIRRGADPIEVSRNLFTYDIDNGGSYVNLLTTLQADIMGLGFIGPPPPSPNAFLDNQNPRQAINLANPAQENVFERATGAPGRSGNVSVRIQWHREDLTTIKEKLNQVGLWGDFSRQDNAREFIHMKFRHSFIQRVVWKEKTKLSKNKYDPQRLKSWLEDDLHQRALNDDDYQTWYIQWCIDRSTARAIPLAQFQNFTSADLTVDERNELGQQQTEARERIYDTSLEAKLKKILTPGEIESVTESLETRTMLSYLFYKMRNQEDRVNVERLIDEMAGVDYDGNITTLDSIIEKAGDFGEQLQQKIMDRDEKEQESTQLSNEIGSNTAPYTGLHKVANDIRTKIDTPTTGLQDRLDAILGQLATPGLSAAQFKALNAQSTLITKQIDSLENKISSTNDRISELNKKLITANKELSAMNREIINTVVSFGDTVNDQLASDSLWGNDLQTALGLNAADWTEFQNNILNASSNKPGFGDTAGENTFVNNFKTFLQTHMGALDSLTSLAKTRKGYFEGRKTSQPKLEKMDSRGLLYKLVKRDTERKGATADPLIEEESLIGTNILIAQARNQEIYGNVNQSIARRIEKGEWASSDEWLASRLFFSPVLSGAEAIEHACDTDKELNKLNGLNINSTPADMIRIMQQNNLVSAVKLRELQKKLSELIRGIDLNGNRIRIFDDDVPIIEKFINNLVIVEARLSAEERLQDVESGIYDTSKSREQQVLQMLQEQTTDSVDADERIAEDLESHDAKFKRFFLKSELKKEFNDAMDELEGLPKEDIEEELRRRGLTARVRSRGIFSLRAARFWKKAGIGALKYNPLSLFGYGLYRGAKWFGGYAKSIVWTDIAQARAKRIRERYKGSIIEPVSTFFVGWPLALGSIIVSRPKKWMRKISDKFSRDK